MFERSEQRATSTLQAEKVTTKEWLAEGWRYGTDVITKLEKRIKFKSDTKILELGCGSNGEFLIPSTRMGIKSLGVDFSFVALQKLHKRIINLDYADKIKLCASDLTDPLPFKDNIFDAVLCHGVICHIKYFYDVRRIIEESVRVTKQKGIIYFSSFLNKYHPTFFPYYVTDKIKENCGIKQIYYYYRDLSEVYDLFSMRELKILNIMKQHVFVPFFETFVYPNYLESLLRLINSIFFSSLPSSWIVVAEKI